MIKLSRILLVFALVGCATGSGFFGQGFKLRPYRDITLKNGLKVTLIDDQSLPYLSMGMLIRVGSTQDPVAQRGLADMVAELLDKGTKRQTATELADSMAQYGGEFNASAGKDATYISANALSFQEEALINHVAEIVATPSFASVEIDRLRKRKLAQMKELMDEPEYVTDVAFEALLYPKSPYGQPAQGTASGIRGIRKKHIVKHYLQYYRPSNAHLAVVGKLSPQTVERLEAAFAKWEDRPVNAMERLAFPQVDGRKIWIVDKSDLQQAQIRFGHKGIARDNPDYVALRTAAAILGGDFSSRLMNEIRVKRGLTYSINSSFDTRLGEGHFEISTFTRHDKIGETVKEVLRVVTEYRDQGPTEQELKEVKSLLKGQFPRALETPEALASNLLYLRFYGVPDSYLTTYLKKVDQLTTEDIRRVLKQYFHPENLKVVVYAPKRKAQPELEGVAPLEVVRPTQFQ